MEELFKNYEVVLQNIVNDHVSMLPSEGKLDSIAQRRYLDNFFKDMDKRANIAAQEVIDLIISNPENLKQEVVFKLLNLRNDYSKQYINELMTD